MATPTAAQLVGADAGWLDGDHPAWFHAIDLSLPDAQVFFQINDAYIAQAGDPVEVGGLWRAAIQRRRDAAVAALTDRGRDEAAFVAAEDGQ